MTDTRTTAASYCAGAVLLIGLLLAAWQFLAIERSVRRQAEFSNLTQAQRGALLLLLNQETGVRGYVATDDPRFLQIFYASQIPARDAVALARRVDAAVPALRPTVQDYARDRRVVEAYLQSEIRLTQTGNRGAALANLYRGKTLFDRFRADDAAILDAVTAQLEIQRRYTIVLSQIGVVLSLVFCGAVIVMLLAFIFAMQRARAYRASSYVDSLTGAGNRRRALSLLRSKLAGPKDLQFGIVFVDLDGFKKINDSYGHAAGDAILKAVVLRMREELRESDEICRMGGDEFLTIVAQPISAAGIEAVAQRLFKAVKRPYSFEGDEYVVGCSLGVSTYPDHGRTAEALLARADRAMYQAKARGGGVQLATPLPGLA